MGCANALHVLDALAVTAGPDMPTPVLGGIVEMVKDPYGFWERQRTLSFPGLSWHSIVGVFTVFVTDAAISRHVFNHNSEVGVVPSLRLCWLVRTAGWAARAGWEGPLVTAVPLPLTCPPLACHVDRRLGKRKRLCPYLWLTARLHLCVEHGKWGWACEMVWTSHAPL